MSSGNLEPNSWIETLQKIIWKPKHTGKSFALFGKAEGCFLSFEELGLVGSSSWGIGSMGSGMWTLVHKSITWPVIMGEGLSTLIRSFCTACCGAHRRATLPSFLLFQPQSKSWPPATPGHLALLAFAVLLYLQWGGPNCCISATPLQTWPPQVHRIHPKTSIVPKSSVSLESWQVILLGSWHRVDKGFHIGHPGCVTSIPLFSCDLQAALCISPVPRAQE